MPPIFSTLPEEIAKLIYIHQIAIIMVKLHTRQKRKLRMQGLGGRNRKARPKTFKTEEAAKKYAEAKGLKNYKLVDLAISRPNVKKIKIVLK